MHSRKYFNMCKVSIIVPVHNAEQYLSNTVESLVAQTYKNIEIILVENGSTDGSFALCHKLAEKDNRIRVMQTEFGDLSHARNEGILASSGDFLAFVDSDDTVNPKMYERMLKLALENNLDIVLCDFVKKYSYRTDRYEYLNSGKITIAPPMEFLKKNFKNQIPQSACTMLCHKKLFDNVRFPVKRYFEDAATTWRLLLAAESAGHIARPFYHYYRHGGSIVHTANFNIHYGHVLADMERIDFINSNSAFPEAEKYDLGRCSLTLFYKHLKKMIKLAKTDEEKQICIKCRDWALTMPHGYKIRLKYRWIYSMIHYHWKIFCFMLRGEVLRK